MALSSLSLINYNLQVTTLNRYIDFKAVLGGATLTATLDLGFYSIAGLAQEISTQMNSVDASNNYTVTVDRTLAGGTQNRMSITTTGTYLSLLFGTGPNHSTSAAPLIGFNPLDYTGNTTYTGSASIGTALIPSQIGYNYLNDLNQVKVFGAVNVSASGLKEAVTFNFQKFINVEFKYEPKTRLQEWQTFFLWAIQQRPFDFMPEVSAPSTVYQVTLDKTSYDGKGLGFQMKEMLPQFPNVYTTQDLSLRIIEAETQFISQG